VGPACHLFPHPVQQNARAWRVKQKPHGPRGAPSTESQQNTKIHAAPPGSLGLLRSTWYIKQELAGRLILINRREKESSCAIALSVRRCRDSGVVP
jgi:hypothetical protein